MGPNELLKQIEESGIKPLPADTLDDVGIKNTCALMGNLEAGVSDGLELNTPDKKESSTTDLDPSFLDFNGPQ